MFTLKRPAQSLGVLLKQFSSTSAVEKLQFNWKDGLNLGAVLNADERAIMDSAHEFCQAELQPRALECWRKESFDREIMRSMGSAGLLGPKIRGYGCAGVNTVSYGLVAREVERVDSGFRSAMSVQSSLVMYPIDEFGTKEQKDRFLPRLASGELVGCFGLTEPDHGSDPSSMKTCARPHSTKKDVYVLNGAKTWITNAPIGDLFLVWAKLDGKVRGFLVERDAVGPGLSTPAIKHKVALRASLTGSIFLDNVEIPKENMLPNAEGLKGPFTCLNSARLGIAWGTMGALEQALSIARAYSLERVQFGHPLANYQLIQMKLANALTDVNYGLIAALHVSRLEDKGYTTPEMISMIKRQNCDRALSDARDLMQIFGGNATASEYDIGRIAHNLQVVQTYEGQSDIHAMILGRALTGISAFC